MRHQDIKLNTIHKLTGNPYVIRPLKVLLPKQDENTNNYIVVKCEHIGTFCSDYTGVSGRIRYFRPRDIEKIT
jgi:hypothetical protein